MSPDASPTLDHVGVNIPEASFPFWQELLNHLGFALDLDGNHFDAHGASGTFICVTATKPGFLSADYHRRHTGLSHLAVRVASHADVDAFVSVFLEPRHIRPLYGGVRDYDYAPGYRAVYFEDPSRLKIEVMTSNPEIISGGLSDPERAVR
jgi:catechol 2,3-dioxygenase-like lactoylglutathione lyase family enzyme